MTLLRRDKSGGFSEVFKYTDLLVQLVSRDIKNKYRRSVLGYLWSILNPLLVMLVMYFVFSKIFDRNIPNFPVYIFIGRTMYEFVIGSTNKAMGGITDNASLLKKTYVSKYMFPLAKTTSSMVDYVFSLGALLIVLIFTHSEFYWTMLLFPLITVEAYFFACGLGFILATLHTFFRDTRYIYNAFTTMWLYASAIFYPVDILPEWMYIFVNYFNPLYIYIKQFRDIAYSGTLPDFTTTLTGVCYAALFFVLGVVVFRDKQDKFILYI